MKKQPIDRAATLKLARTMKTILTKRGKKITTLKLSDKPSDEDICKQLLGRSGTMRAPVLQVGQTLLAGWHEETFKSLLEGS